MLLQLSWLEYHWLEERLRYSQSTSLAAPEQSVGDNLVEVDVVVAGEVAKIAFTGCYLEDVLSRIDTAQVAIVTTSPSSPGVIGLVGARTTPASSCPCSSNGRTGWHQ